MNIDEVARRAGRDLRASVDADADVESSWEHFELLRSRRRQARVAAVAVAAALVVVALLVQLLGTAGRHSEEPARPPTEIPPSAESGDGPGAGCDTAVVECLRGRTYTVYLDAPLTWTVPEGYGAPYSSFMRGQGNFLTHAPGRGLLVSRTADGTAGVTVAEHVSAATLGASPRAVPGVLTAEDFVTWLASRPFLTSSAVDSEERDGVRTWTVTVRVARSGGSGPTRCSDGSSCFPLITIPRRGAWWVGGVPAGMVSRFTALDVHGSGTTVVWAWTLEGDIPPEAVALADSVRFD